MIQIINSIETMGYRKLNPESNNVYGRVQDDTVYVVVIGSNRNLEAESLKNFNEKLVTDIEMSSHRKVKLLNILMVRDGMFDKDTLNIVEKLDNVWLFTEDYGKLYVFENQPADFDNLYNLIDKQTVIENEKINAKLKRMFGVVTPALVIINLIMYLLCVYMSHIVGDFYLESKLSINLSAIYNNHEYYRLLSSMFIHFGFMHLFGNMIILVALGARIEAILGKLNYILVYIATGFVAAFSSYVHCFYNHTYDYAAGASGAIFGLLGVLVAVALANRGKVKDLSLMNMILLTIITIVDGYMSEGIDNIAHIAGFVAGLVAGALLMLNNQKVVKRSHL
jgi:rhomboid protease GluP